MKFALVAAACLVISLSAVSHAADPGGRFTLEPNTFLNFDSGVVSNETGDILWNGVTLVPQGHAAVFNLGKYGARTFNLISSRQAAAAPYKSDPIGADSLVAGDIFGVRTNAGNHAKVLVTGTAGGSLSLQFSTFVIARSRSLKPAASGPTIADVKNNYSYIYPGLPNYGVAPGVLFVIFGTGLSSSAPPVLQSSAPPGLPTTLNQTTISVTVKGVTTTPAIYYTAATAVAAVLPSNTPAGTGTVTVTYNGVASNAAPIQVVANAPGLDTLYGTGNGLGVMTDNASGNVITVTSSATPGETIVLWGSGIGADTGNDDRTYPQIQNNLTSIPLQVFIGGVSATVLYRGRSQFPGLDQIDVTVPPTVTPGCFVSVTMMVGSIVSNAVTMPVSANGGVCSDAASGLNGTMIQTLANKSSGTVNTAFLSLIQQRGSIAALGLPAPLPSAYYGKGYEYASQGSCTVVPPEQGGFNPNNTLDTGALLLTTPSGQVAITGLETPLSGSTLAPGTYTFTAAGGKDIGSFKASVTVQSPLTVTNTAALGLITRAQGATVTWSGGFPNGDVQVEGELGGAFGDIRFYCHAPSSAGQLLIPPSILLALPPGSGDLVVTNATAPTMINATGLDVGIAAATSFTSLSTTFK